MRSASWRPEDRASSDRKRRLLATGNDTGPAIARPPSVAARVRHRATGQQSQSGAGNSYSRGPATAGDIHQKHGKGPPSDDQQSGNTGTARKENGPLWAVCVRLPARMRAGGQACRAMTAASAARINTVRTSPGERGVHRASMGNGERFIARRPPAACEQATERRSKTARRERLACPPPVDRAPVVRRDYQRV